MKRTFYLPVVLTLVFLAWHTLARGQDGGIPLELPPAPGLASPPNNATVSESVPTSSSGGATFAAGPAEGYVVDQWLVDAGIVQTGGNSYTLQNIQAPHTVSLTFGGEPGIPIPRLETFEVVLAPAAETEDYFAPFVTYDPDAPGAAEKGPYRMWFAGAKTDRSKPGWYGDLWIGHAWSKDGRTFEHPEVVHTAHPRGDVIPGYYKIGYPVVIRESGEYRLYHWDYYFWWCGGWAGYLSVSVGSADGINYADHIAHAMDPLCMSGGWDNYVVEPGSLLKENGEYVLYYAAYGDIGTPGQGITIGRAVSPDGITWPHAEGEARQQVLRGTRGEADWNCGVLCPCAVRRGGGPDPFWMFFSGRDGKGDYTVGFAGSADGVNWGPQTRFFDTAELVEATGLPIGGPSEPRYFRDPESGIEYLYFACGVGGRMAIARVVISAPRPEIAFHPCDGNQDLVIDDWELLHAIDAWARNERRNGWPKNLDDYNWALLELIDLWAPETPYDPEVIVYGDP